MCGSTRLCQPGDGDLTCTCDWHEAQKKLDQRVELAIRKKALDVPNFPDQKVNQNTISCKEIVGVCVCVCVPVCMFACVRERNKVLPAGDQRVRAIERHGTEQTSNMEKACQTTSSGNDHGNR